MCRRRRRESRKAQSCAFIEFYPYFWCSSRWRDRFCGPFTFATCFCRFWESPRKAPAWECLRVHASTKIAYPASVAVGPTGVVVKSGLARIRNEYRRQYRERWRSGRSRRQWCNRQFFKASANCLASKSRSCCRRARSWSARLGVASWLSYHCISAR